MLRRTILAALPASLAAGRASAQAYPNKPITIVVPFAAGGPTDLMARIVGERMAKELGQQFIIDNTTGAAGTIAVGKVARAAPDGYTISIGHVGTHVANGTIYKNLTYNLLTDLEPIARLPANPMLVVTSEQVPAKTLKELVELLKANPDKIPGGTAGMGSGSHLGALAFFAATGTKYQLVPYRGTGPAMQDLDRQPDPGDGRPVVEFAAAGPRRQDQGLCRDRQGTLVRCAGDPDGGRGRLSDGGLDLARPVGAQGHAAGDRRPAQRRRDRHLQDPDIRRRMEDLGQDIPTPAEMAPAAFAAFHKDEYARWAKILEAANVKVE